MKKLSNTEAELKKSVAYKKSVHTKILTVLFLINAEPQLSAALLILRSK